MLGKYWFDSLGASFLPVMKVAFLYIIMLKLNINSFGLCVSVRERERDKQRYTHTHTHRKRERDRCSYVQFSHLVVSNSLWPHGLQHARLPCPSPSPGVCSNSCPLSRTSIYTALISFVHFSQVCAGAWQHKQKQSQEVPGVQGAYSGRWRAAKWVQRASKVWGSSGKGTNTFFS